MEAMALAILVAGVLLVLDRRAERTRRAADVELLCDTIMRAVGIAVKAPGAVLPGPRTPIVPVPKREPLDWDAEALALRPVPTPEEVDDTLDATGDPRLAAEAMMRRRGLDPDDDADVLEFRARCEAA